MARNIGLFEPLEKFDFSKFFASAFFAEFLRADFWLYSKVSDDLKFRIGCGNPKVHQDFGET